MIRIGLVSTVILYGTTFYASARGEYPLYRAEPQPAAQWAVPQYPQVPFAQAALPAYGGAGYLPVAAPYGYGYSPYGYRSFPRYGIGLGYGFGYGGVVGYYPPNPYGNMNWIAPNPPSPYYVVPSASEYREQTRRRDEAIYTEMLLKHGIPPSVGY